MKNRKGFTLIELLGVIVIIGILLGIAIPQVYKYIKRGTKEYYSSLEDTVKLAARDYLSDYNRLLPRTNNNVTVITLEELELNKYIDDVVDSDGNSCDIKESKVIVKKIDNGNYEYYSCLYCGDSYSTDNESCNLSEEDNVDIETKYYSVVVEEEKYIVSQGDSFELPYAKAYYKEELVSSEVSPSPKTIDTNKLGTTTVKYAYHGKTKEIEVEVIDNVSPTTPEIVIRYDNKSGKEYKDNWYSGEIYAEFNSTDYSKAGVLGSGIKEYQISSDNSTWTSLNNNYYVSSIDKEYTYYVRSIDNSGNISEIATYTTKVDTEYPTFDLKVDGEKTSSDNEWYIGDVTISIENANDSVSGVALKVVSESVIDYDTTGKTVTASVTDLAGNTTTKTITVKRDTVNPTCTNSGDSTSWATSRTIYYGCSDGQSGCNSSYSGGSETFTTTTWTTTMSSYTIKDYAGHTVTCSSRTANVYVDETNPTVTASVSGKVITISMSDTGSGIYGYNITTSSSTPSSWTTGTTTSYTASSAGTYYIHVKDNAGRTNYASVTIASSAFCSYTTGAKWTFNYTGGVQTFTVPCSGTYKLEVWGAQGGSFVYPNTSRTGAVGGTGGYASGNIYLSAGDSIYIVVGQAGSNSVGTGSYDNWSCTYASSTYNGGGYGNCQGHKDGFSYQWHYSMSGSGGGATHIATSNHGELKNYSSYKSDVLIVAGGGGGAFHDDEPEENGGDDVYYTFDGLSGGYSTAGGGSFGGELSTYYGYGGYSGGGGWSGGKSCTYCNYVACNGGTNYVNRSLSNTSSTTSDHTGNGYAQITLVSINN